jgi:TM2 domain-containing membrane protein YozV
MKRIYTNMTVMALAIIVFLSACSVERRHYRPGLHFNSEVKTPKPEVKKHDAQKETTAEVAPVEIAPVEATAKVEHPVSAVPHAATTSTDKKETTANKSVKAAPKPVTQPGDKNIATSIISKKVLKGQSPKGMMADKILAIILCIFLGWLGIHRFYLGFPISGIFMILLFLLSTIGGFLIINFLGYIAGVLLLVWIIYDLICIILDRPLFFEK